MPYRIYFGQIGERLKATYDGSPNAYQTPEELLADVQLAADSLAGNRGRHAGYFLVRRFIRRVRTFGFHLATLDVTQFAHVHDEVIAQGLGMPQWPTLPRAERLRQLRDLLARDQGPTAPLDAVGRRTLWVFDAIVHAQHKIGARAIGGYIVSGAEGPEDVLAVLLLARWADIIDKRSGECRPRRGAVARFGRLAGKRRRVAARPERRARLSPSPRGARQSPMGGDRILRQQQGSRHRGVALVIASRATSAVGSGARQPGSRSRYFTVAAALRRAAAGRTEHLVEAAPDGAIRGVLRLTEQGEVVNQSYGLRPIAMRTLERTFSAVALATARSGTQAAGRPQAQLAAMQTIAARSLEAYRQLVFDNAQFAEFLRAATPLDVIERMHIGSRPAARAGGDGIGSLRAIPWVFAWTQSRHMLPGWFGFGSGLEAALQEHGARGHRRDVGAMAVLRTSARRRRGHAGADRSRRSPPTTMRWRATLCAHKPRPSAGSTRSRSVRCCGCAATVRCSTAIRPCSAPSDCAIPMSIPCISCRWICSSAGARPHAKMRRCSARCAPPSAVSHKACKPPADGSGTLRLSVQHSGTFTARPPCDVSL